MRIRRTIEPLSEPQGSMPAAPNSSAPSSLLTVPEVAEMLSCSTRYVRKLISAGALRVFRPSSTIVRVHLASLNQFIDERSSGGSASRAERKDILRNVGQY